jgi:hypothetical protein
MTHEQRGPEALALLIQIKGSSAGICRLVSGAFKRTPTGLAGRRTTPRGGLSSLGPFSCCEFAAPFTVA